jgi:hypothetical protein
MIETEPGIRQEVPGFPAHQGLNVFAHIGEGEITRLTGVHGCRTGGQNLLQPRLGFQGFGDVGDGGAAQPVAVYRSYGNAVQAGEEIPPIRPLQSYGAVLRPRSLENPRQLEAEAVSIVHFHKKPAGFVDQMAPGYP